MRRRGTTWIAPTSATALAIAPIALAALVACGAPPSDGGAGDFGDTEATGSESSAIYGGVVDTGATATDAVVAVVATTTAGTFLCTGALIAPNVVLTARHCVSDMKTTEVACDEKGVSATGDQIAADRAASTLKIYVGPVADPSAAPASRGKTVFHPTSGVLCNQDVSLIVLTTPITSVKPLALRRASGAVVGETFRAVGYGQNDIGKTMGTRLRRAGVKVLAKGSKVTSSKTALGTNEIEVGQGACEGDSGGPAISEKTGAVIGVVSRGGDCTSPNGLVYTSPSGFADLFAQTFAAAGGAPIEETGGPVEAVPVQSNGSDAGALGGDSGRSSDSNATTAGGTSTARPSFAASTGGCAASGVGRGARSTSPLATAVAFALGIVAIRRKRPRA